MPTYCFIFYLCKKCIFLLSFYLKKKTLSHQSCVLTAFPQRPKHCRSPRYTLCSRQQRCVRAVRALCHASPRTPRVGNYLEHAQRQCCGLAFAQRVRQRAVRRLWQHCEVFYSAVGAPRARLKWKRYIHKMYYNKNKPQLKHLVIKAIRCTLLSTYDLLYMLQVLRDFPNTSLYSH